MYNMMEDIGESCFNCGIDVSDITLERQPLFTNQYGRLLMSDNDFSNIIHGEQICVVCEDYSTTNLKNDIIVMGERQKKTSMVVTCDNGELKDNENNVVSVKDIKCKEWPKDTIKPLPIQFTDPRTGQLNPHITSYSVGFELQSGWHETYRVCFDHAMNTPLFARVTLRCGSQPGRGKFKFVQDTVYRSTNEVENKKIKFDKKYVDKFYGLDNQMKKFEAINKDYISKTQFLTRGHLVPSAYLPLRSQQKTTFRHMNVAPQWSLINAGNWAAIEQSVQKLAASSGRKLHVYVGVLGHLQLPDAAGRPRAVSLGDELVPLHVPDHFYMALVDQDDSWSIAIICANNPYFKPTEQTLLFENTIDFKKLDWIECDPENVAKGFITFTHLSDFLQVVNIPEISTPKIQPAPILPAKLDLGLSFVIAPLLCMIVLVLLILFVLFIRTPSASFRHDILGGGTRVGAGGWNRWDPDGC